MKLAAIDIGSNSIHLVVAEARPDHRFEIITREKEMVRLAAGALNNQRLTRPRIERALDCIDRFARLARSRGVKHIIAAATSAVREAANKNEFLQRVKQRTCIKVSILSGVEEARLISLAVSEAMHIESGRALIIDIGGGSTEFIITDGQQPLLLNSMRLGAVRLAERIKLSDPVKKKELAALQKQLRAEMARTAQEIKAIGFHNVIGTSGTILNLVSLAAQNDTRKTDLVNALGAVSENCTLDDLAQVNSQLAALTIKERKRVAGLDPKRADIIITGGQLLETILRELGARAITTCDWSLREGLLLDYLARHAARAVNNLAASSFEEKQLNVRDRTILAIARRYEYQPAHAHQVARLAGKLFQQMHTLHELAGEDLALLQYAALLHDIGYHIAHSGHHRHAYYLIQHAEMPGFNAEDVTIIANVARFHRGARPRRRTHPEYAKLPRRDRNRILKLSALLRIADALDRSHSAIVSDLRVTQKDDNWQIDLYADNDCELELWYAQSAATYFEKVFRVKISLQTVTQPLPTQGGKDGHGEIIYHGRSGRNNLRVALERGTVGRCRAVAGQ